MCLQLVTPIFSECLSNATWQVQRDQMKIIWLQIAFIFHILHSPRQKDILG